MPYDPNAAAKQIYDQLITAIPLDTLRDLVHLLQSTVPGPPSDNYKTTYKPKKEAKRQSRREYPYFARHGEHLVRVGQSRHSPGEYKHEIPHTVINMFVSQFLRANANGKPVTICNLTIITNRGIGRICHSLVYDVVSWIRHLKLIHRLGRSGYVLNNGCDLAKAVETAWQALPTWER